jgi:hypothetical protein
VKDLNKLPPLQQQMYLCAQRGADWLRRANRTDGKFVYGHVPALKASLEGDQFLRQAGAAFTLARAAQFLGDERYAVVARQAVLTLLLETAQDPADPQVRSTTLPPLLVNRLGAAGQLVMAINELSSPNEDLLESSEQLCRFIRSQQGPDGSLNLTTPGDAGVAAEPDGIHHHPGAALYGLMLSQRHRPAAWKTDVVRKAMAYYRPWWQQNKNLSFVTWQSAAYAEAFLKTQESPFAEFVFEMAEWVGKSQYTQLDPKHPLWTGGFMEWPDGKPSTSVPPLPPQVLSAAYAGALSEACRLAKQAGDLPRYQRFRESLERALQFVTTLQYTDANTQHFSEWYRPTLLGAFHVSHQDGNIRIDYTQHAVSVLVQYLMDVVD